MAISTLEPLQDVLADLSDPVERALLDTFEEAFGQSFAVVDLSAGVLERVTPDWPRVDVFRWLPTCEQVARSGRVEVLEEHPPLLLLAVPIPGAELSNNRVGVTVLLTESDPADEPLASAARAFGVDAARIVDWVGDRRSWPAHAAIALGKAIQQSEAAGRQAKSAKSQLSEVSSQMLATFEELHVMHQLTQGLNLGRTHQELADQAVHWLADIVPSDCVIAQLFDDGSDATSPATICGGSFNPLAKTELRPFFESLGPEAGRRALVLNREHTSSPTWPFPGVREVVSAPVIVNGEPVGWLGALNHRPKRGATEDSFGSVEASLLWSVATLIGVHAGNRRLFQERTTLFESVVHALTSAIDAKDPYTCGHSDRVARIAVRLARQLGCDREELNALYLGGLLHDIGKIGIPDHVLQKPTELTSDEYEVIKQHPVLGERILRETPQLAHIVPIVLHHHEAWDGGGYPDGLEGPRTPLLARIIAVADAIDAMNSNRPYRKGMPIERVEDLLREGAGSQWDPSVVEAYFEAREDIAAIRRIDREPLDLNVGRWEVGDACPLS